MNKLTWFWNILHYNLYRWEVYASKCFNYPVKRFLQNRHIKHKYAQRGVDNPHELIDFATNDPKYGTNILIAGGASNLLMFLVVFSVFNLLRSVGLFDFYPKLVHYLLLAGLAATINYLLLFKNDKYLNYFKEFKKMSTIVKNRYGWLSFLTVLSIIALTVFSFLYAN